MEKYLAQCLDSIEAQTYRNWEALLIDDGSTDSTSEICRSYLNRDARFKYFYTPNKGVYPARNIGLNEAKGDFVSFIDPDDWVEPDFLKVLYDTLINNKAEVSQCNYSADYKYHKNVSRLANGKILLTRNEVLKGLMSNSVVPCYLWNKLYKKEIITEVFPDGRSFQDSYTVPEWLKNITQMAQSPKVLYHYRMRKNSVSNKMKGDNLREMIKGCTHVPRRVFQLIPEEFSKQEMDNRLFRIYVNVAKKMARKIVDKKERIENIEIISKTIGTLNGIDCSRIKKRTGKRGMLLKENPEKFIKKMRLTGRINFSSVFWRLQMFD